MSKSFAIRTMNGNLRIRPWNIAFAFVVGAISLIPAGVSRAQMPDPAAQPQDLRNVIAQPQDGAILPSESLGADDLLEITVTYCPELTRNFRVGSDGNLTLPLLHRKLVVTGLTPAQVGEKLQKALVEEGVMADPTVNVSVLEYRSRPVSVSGAVNRPLTFQATGKTTLLDAIARAGGVTATAGGNIIVTDNHQSSDAAASGTLESNVKIIPMRQLLAGTDPKYNLHLSGGEEIRIPEASKIVIGGDVKKPGVYLMQSDAETTVMKAIALSGGLDSYSSAKAYICRRPVDGGECSQIEVSIRDIMARKSPDVALAADDYLYVPTSNAKKITVRVLNDLAGMAAGVGTGLAVYH